MYINKIKTILMITILTLISISCGTSDSSLSATIKLDKANIDLITDIEIKIYTSDSLKCSFDAKCKSDLEISTLTSINTLNIKYSNRAENKAFLKKNGYYVVTAVGKKNNLDMTELACSCPYLEKAKRPLKENDFKVHAGDRYQVSLYLKEK